MTDTQAINVATLERGFARDLALAGVAASLGGFAFWGAQHATVGDAWLWQGGTGLALVAALLAAARATAKQKRMRDAARNLRRADAPEIVKGLLLLTGPKPAKPATAEKVAKPANEEAPKVSAIERERERLRAGGFSDAEISQILIARESQGGHAGGGFGTGIATGLLNNLDAIVTYARNLLPSFKNDVARMLDPEADAATRITGAAAVALKTAAVVVFGYFIYLEALQLRSMAYKSWAEACIERQKNAINFSTMGELMSPYGPERKLDAECRGL